MVVVEDAADAARLLAVRQEEIVVAPGLEARIVGRVVAVAGRRATRRGRPRASSTAAGDRGASASGRRRRRTSPCVVTSMRVFICTAGTRGLCMCATRLMPRGPEARILGGARDLRAEVRAELAPDGRDVDADLLEHPAVHHAHHAAAAVAAILGRALPWRALEPPGRPVGRAGRPARPRSPRIRRRSGRADRGTRLGRGLAQCGMFVPRRLDRPIQSGSPCCPACCQGSGRASRIRSTTCQRPLCC